VQGWWAVVGARSTPRLQHSSLAPTRKNSSAFRDTAVLSRELGADQLPLIPQGFGARFLAFQWSVVHAGFLCLLRVSACVVFSRQRIAVRFRGIPVFIASVIITRKSESNPS
jgi:hypothetical protein